MDTMATTSTMKTSYLIVHIVFIVPLAVGRAPWWRLDDPPRDQKSNRNATCTKRGSFACVSATVPNAVEVMFVFAAGH
jgi:hypothetical protein